MTIINFNIYSIYSFFKMRSNNQHKNIFCSALDKKNKN